MPFEVENQSYVGVTTLMRRTRYVFTFKPRHQIKEFMAFTCGREHYLGDDELQLSSNVVRFEYRPMWGVEYFDACPVFAVSISKEGMRETAVIDINNGDRAKAKVRCNGHSVAAEGAYLCQTRGGLYVGIQFDAKMYGEADEGCNAPEEQSFYEWEIKTSKGHCSYVFSPDGVEFFRLTVRGYESILEVDTND